MFQEIDENFYILIENIAGVRLVQEDNKYVWIFYTNHPHPLKSKSFETKEEAIIWFKNIKYNYYKNKEWNIYIILSKI